MNQPTTRKVRWNTTDLELFPEDGKRYEIIDGELFVTRAPHWKHQRVCVRISTALDNWSQITGLGEVAIAPGIILGDNDNVIPDVVWASNERLSNLLDEAGHLTAAPELVVEVLSLGNENERRDRELKLKLYSSQGVREYWIIDWRKQQVEVYRREQGILKLVVTLFHGDELNSPLLPNFTCAIAPLFG
ncbi:Uma2 family endonuclease [Nostoc parmelioides]|uniref:Uma2 family endonuclease n=1 Tax=Nostoc parmelioides FACHB-3921 TaxID=2692909 RepID=A0ABR8BD36_9NOSO|nr:Uma2 family endonuclease [Nostoc parmelioides]MBD2251634.1 Uma2 family endonuclease [Nostoc parmelioides FACHB-3921]